VVGLRASQDPLAKIEVYAAAGKRTLVKRSFVTEATIAFFDMFPSSSVMVDLLVGYMTLAERR
jgi:hypothetical protein